MKPIPLLLAAAIAMALTVPASALTIVQVGQITASAIHNGYKVNPHDKSLVKNVDGTIVVQLPDVKLPDTKLPDTKVVVPATGGIPADWADPEGPCGPWHEYVGVSKTFKFQRDCVFVGVQSKQLPGPSEYTIPGAVIPGATIPGGTRNDPVCNTSTISFSHNGHNPLTGYAQSNSSSQSNGAC